MSASQVEQMVSAEQHAAVVNALRDCVAALDSVMTQAEQMRGMFPDTDRGIANALFDGADATRNAQALLKHAGPWRTPNRVVVEIRGGNLCGVYADAPDGVTVHVRDHDNIEMGDEDVPADVLGIISDRHECVTQ